MDIFRELEKELDEMSCPKCGSEINFEEVDIGIGTITGNYHCDKCGWRPEDEFPEIKDLWDRDE